MTVRDLKEILNNINEDIDVKLMDDKGEIDVLDVCLYKYKNNIVALIEKE